MQVSEDKLAIKYRTRVAIYNLADGREIFSRGQINAHRLQFIENRYALLYFTVGIYHQKEHKLLVIEQDSLRAREMTIRDKIITSANLGNELLALGGQRLSIWKIDKWPFEFSKSDICSVFKLVTLATDCFAGVVDKNVFIWDGSLKLLHKLNIIDRERFIVELKALPNDVLLVNTFLVSEEHNFLLFNFRSGVLLKELRIKFIVRNLFLTPDKEFLVMAGK